tara:strand:+ start:1779 stop:2588 length:810 start_codon:yes stop_codon:yes gene_type:complete
MTQGFLIFAQNSTADYVKQAYLLALSGLYSGNFNFTIVTDNKINDEYEHAFDKIIYLKDDAAKDSEWKIENRSKAYELSPYDETIVLDSDVLLLDLIDWNRFKDTDLYFTSNPTTYRGEAVNSSYYRRAFIDNNLLDLYTGMYFFKKTKRVNMFFQTLELVVSNWKDFYSIFCKKYVPKHCSIDISAAIACELLEISPTTDKIDIINFVHMKPHAQNWKVVSLAWQDNVNTYFNNNLKIGNYKQTGVFHYTEKNFCDKILPRYIKLCLK